MYGIVCTFIIIHSMWNREYFTQISSQSIDYNCIHYATDFREFLSLLKDIFILNIWKLLQYFNSRADTPKCTTFICIWGKKMYFLTECPSCSHDANLRMHVWSSNGKNATFTGHVDLNLVGGGQKTRPV